jgi:hypothetical protein
MHDEQVIESPETRSGFLRRVAKLTAIGLGVALVPVTNAWAPQSQCCPDSTHCPACPPMGGQPFRCNGGCGGCCACVGDHTACYFTSLCPC